MILLRNAMVYDERFEPCICDIKIDGERISFIGSILECGGKCIDLSGHTIVPGFIDIHIHGCAGADTCDALPVTLPIMSNHLVNLGITSFCPTSVTLPYNELLRVFNNVAKTAGGVTGAYVHGINMEGPYISNEKKGAQNESYIRKPDVGEFKKLYSACNGMLSIVDIAPELDGSDKFFHEVNPICAVSIAHTDAGYEETVKAIALGFRHVTHLYNAMNGISHRSPGAVGAIFESAIEKGIFGELICDGIHIHPAALRVAFRELGGDGSIIVSDSMRAAGSYDGEYLLGDLKVYVRDGKATLADGTICASTSNVFDGFKYTLSIGVPMKQALKSVTINPARAIRVDKHTGSIAIGKFADLLVLDKNMDVAMVMVKGRIVVG